MSSHRKQTLIAALVAAASIGATLLGTAPAAQADGRIIYVAPDGSDSASRISAAAQPVASIARAIRLAQPGDTILVKAGTYTGAAGYGAVPGRPGAPITLAAAPGARVVLKGTLQLEKADYWRIDGINVTRDPASPRKEFLVKFDGGTGWQFLNSEVWGSKGVSNVMISGSAKDGAPRNYRIAGDCIHDNNATGDAFMNDHNIYLMPGYSSGPGVIEHNILFNSENGAGIKAAGPSSSTGAAQVLIRRNTIARAAAGVIIGYGTTGVQLRNNLIGQQVKSPPAGAQFVANYNAAIIGNHVTGTGNASIATATWGYRYSVKSTVDSRHPIKGAMTNWVKPALDSTTSCSGFHPANATAKRYGRYS